MTFLKKLWLSFLITRVSQENLASRIVANNGHPSLLHLRDKYELSIDQFPVGLIAQLVRASAPVSQRSCVRFPFKPEFFQVSSFQLLKLKRLHCDDLHIILMGIHVVAK